VRSRFLAYAIYGLLVVAALIVAAREPLLFQKLNTLMPATGFPPLARSSSGPLEIEEVLGSIPLKVRASWAVHPKRRYERTIIEGLGNCSQLSFGLAYALEQSGRDYQIIHMLNPAGLQLGEGHTVIRVRYQLDDSERLGLVDMVSGGLLQVGERELDVEVLNAGPVEDLAFRPLNAAARSPLEYFSNRLNASVVAYVPSSEVRRYYDFLNAVYLPLGHEKVEKYVFDGMALLLGFLPRVYMPRYEAFMSELDHEPALYRASLWTLRSTLLMVPLILGIEIVRWLAAGPRRDP
jgi:hypothetical protein